MNPTAPKRTRNSKALLTVTATTYLVLGLALGIHAAFTLVIAAAVVALWIAACRRFPVVGHYSYVFFYGFVGGLLSGLLGNGAGAAYYRAPRRIRRR